MPGSSKPVWFADGLFMWTGRLDYGVSEKSRMISSGSRLSHSIIS